MQKMYCRTRNLTGAHENKEEKHQQEDKKHNHNQKQNHDKKKVE